MAGAGGHRRPLIPALRRGRPARSDAPWRDHRYESREILEPIARGSGAFNHAQTFSHTPVICAAGVAALRYLKAHRLVERCRSLEAPLFAALSRLRRFPQVGDIRGRGLLAAVEFVRDRVTRQPFARAERFVERVTARAFEHGLLIWPNVGHVDGRDGDLVIVAPPFVIEEAQIDDLASRLERALEDVVRAA